MNAQITYRSPTYFVGRNGAFSQTGLEVMTSDHIRGCGQDPGPMQAGILLTPIGNRGPANCTITVPANMLNQLIRKLKDAKKELKDARGTTDQAPEPADGEAAAPASAERGEENETAEV